MPERVQFSQPELTTGRPYHVYMRLLNKVKIYGMHEYSSTLPFFITFLNVNLGKQSKIERVKRCIIYSKLIIRAYDVVR